MTPVYVVVEMLEHGDITSMQVFTNHNRADAVFDRIAPRYGPFEVSADANPDDMTGLVTGTLRFVGDELGSVHLIRCDINTALWPPPSPKDTTI